jgi:ankyrin repeat protein
VNASDKGGSTALLAAARSVEVEAIDLLLEAGADPNASGLVLRAR